MSEFRIDKSALWMPTIELQWSGPLRKYKRTYSNDNLISFFPEVPLKIIDIGCGPVKFKSRSIDQVFGMDHNFFPGVDFVCDLANTAIPFEDGSIDFVYSSHFIEHLDYRERDFVFREVKRVLKPGGLFFFKVPHFSHYWISAWDHKITNYGVGIAHTIANGVWYSHVPFFHVVGVGLNWRVDLGENFFNKTINKILNKSFRFTEAYLAKLLGGVQEIQYLLVKPL